MKTTLASLNENGDEIMVVVGCANEDYCAARFEMHILCHTDDILFLGYLVAELVGYGVVVFWPLSLWIDCSSCERPSLHTDLHAGRSLALTSRLCGSISHFLRVDFIWSL